MDADWGILLHACLLGTFCNCCFADPAAYPVRYPFLLVDRVVEVEYGKSAVGYKNITVNDQFFNGHFPERAIMPGERLQQ